MDGSMMSAMSATNARIIGHVAALLIAMTSAVVGFRLASPRIGSHDEGVYVATARALADSGEYRLIDLPSQPLQTKYPPLYPALLAVIDRTEGSTPAHLHALKIVNAVALAVIVILTGELAFRLAGDPWRSRVAAALLAGTSLALMSFVDLVQSDLLLVALWLSALLTLPTDRDNSRRGLLCGLWLGLGILTRVAGLAFAAGAVLTCARRRLPRALMGLSATTTCLAIPWLLWTIMQRPGPLEPLEQYYVSYEPSAWLMLASAPAVGMRVVVVNALDYFRSCWLILDSPAMPVGMIVVAGVALGALRVRDRSVLGAALTMSAVYVVIVLGHPMAMARYLLPLASLAVALMGVAVAPAPESPSGALRTFAGVGCVAAVLTAHVFELRHYASVPRTAVHVGFGQTLPASRVGFDESMEWIRRNTATDAVIASGNDTLLFIETGRRAIRPWHHRPLAYNPEYRVSERLPSESIDASAELRRLRVSYLAIDPLLPDLEGAHAAETFRTILEDRADGWTLVFVSSDGAHKIYRRSEWRP
jgi:hypothetical protein